MHTLNFTDNELLVINDALVNMPYGRVVTLINNINAQLEQAANKTTLDGGEVDVVGG